MNTTQRRSAAYRWTALGLMLAAAPAFEVDLMKPQAATLFAGEAGRSQTVQATDIQETQRARPSKAVLIPAGTTVNVRLSQGIDVDSTQTGATLQGRVDDPIMIDGQVVIPREAAVVIEVASVKQSGTLKGSDRISLKLNSIAFGDRVYEVVTGYAVEQGKGEGARTARKVGVGAGLGAILGGIADGGDGAAIGAVVGGITGTIIAASGEEHLKLPAETLLQFELTAAIRVYP